MLTTSTVYGSPPKPGWHTDELEQEWIEPEITSTDHPQHEDSVSKHSRSDHSFVDNCPATESPVVQGTFIVREDQSPAPILPGPVQNKKGKNLFKDFFSPLALETMFEPPSPKLSAREMPESVSQDEGDGDAILASDIPNLACFDGRKPSCDYKFTFSASQAARMPSSNTSQTPRCELVQSQAPATDPRLRLFQFQYDTFTREHLSAIVDSIAHTPSNSNSSEAPNLPSNSSLNKQSSNLESDDAYLRATKRLKLTPPDNLSHNSETAPKRPRKDYIGESRNLMRNIKQARSPSIMTIFSAKENIPETSKEDPFEEGAWRASEMASMWFSDTISGPYDSKDQHRRARPSSCLQPSTACNLEFVHPSTLTPSVSSFLFSSTSNSNSKPSTISSALGYRRRAADLMAQIRNDMTNGKRLFSLESLKDQCSNDMDLQTEKVSLRVSVTPASPAMSSGRTRIQPSPKTQDTLSQLKFPTVTESRDRKGSLPRKVPKRSPRKLLRRLSAADEVDREIAMNRTVSDISLIEQSEHTPIASERQTPNEAPHSQPHSPVLPQQSHLKTPQSFHAQVPTPVLSDQPFLTPPLFSPVIESNRVVSSGTSASITTADSALTHGTTATSATSVITLRTSSTGSLDSAASFIKHPGPVQITRITPQDVPALPDMVGNMRFDRSSMRWIKVGLPKNIEGGLTVVSEESDDPFRDFESLHSGGTADHSAIIDANVHASHTHPNSSQDENLIDDDISGDERVEVPNILLMDSDTDDSFDFDAESGGVVDIMTGEPSNAGTDPETTDSENDFFKSNEQGFPGDSIDESDNEEETARITVEAAIAANAQAATPIPTQRTTRVPRSALKNGNSLQKPVTPASIVRTPQSVYNSAHRRSVSFSDGRREGKILGLDRGSDKREGAIPLFPVEGPRSFSPSARGRRIAAVLEDLANPSSEEETPSKCIGSPQTSRIDSRHPNNLQEQLSNRSFTRSKKAKDISSVQGNQTLLTECSFGIARDKLVHVITDVYPYVPYWETLEQIDLSNKGLDNVARLKEFLPQLDVLNLDNNALAWLTGIPKTARTLAISSNILTAMTSFDQLRNLEVLDISNNHLESLQQLSCLRHLRELKADGNLITSLEGIANLQDLVRLSLKGNKIRSIDFEEINWPKINILNLSRNNLQELRGLPALNSLSVLNLDHNSLESLQADIPKLRTLRVSSNRLRRLEISSMPNIRTLYADNNMLSQVQGLSRLRRLENLSLRNQGTGGLMLNTHDIRDVKRLYLSGNPLPRDFITEPCYNLVYLEVAACRLTELPQGLAQFIPNVRVLNLNYNFLKDVQLLHGLSRLRKLTLIGSRLRGTKSLLRTLRQMPEMEMADFRMNPCTLGWYLPILVQDVPGALQPSEDTHWAHHRQNIVGGNHQSKLSNTIGPRGISWQDLDSKFRNDLPDEAYVGRLAYRGIAMRACPKIKMLDGIIVEKGEREKAERLLQGVLSTKLS